ncbi:MAG: hypothetical protein K0Q59_1591 [Paenibacillus sp.]|nr:hypothetical protein [Paenibacillus sp.]
MNRLWLALLLCAAMLSGCGAKPSMPASSSNELGGLFGSYPELKGRSYTTAQVKRVVDGDTFETNTGEKVRLIGMNTPETVKPNSPVEAYGKQASEYTKKQLTGKTLVMFADAEDKDKYGRLLRYVFLEGEADMFNERLLREGYANTMTIPPNVMFAKKFVEVEREARNKSKGLWGAIADPKQTVAACKDPKIKGNINSKNEKIYHLPGGSSYEQTKAEMMFCTEEDAAHAGFRKAG